MRISDWSSDVCSSDLKWTEQCAFVGGITDLDCGEFFPQCRQHLFTALLADHNDAFDIDAALSRVKRAPHDDLFDGMIERRAWHDDGDRKSTRLNSSH